MSSMFIGVSLQSIPEFWILRLTCLINLVQALKESINYQTQVSNYDKRYLVICRQLDCKLIKEPELCILTLGGQTLIGPLRVKKQSSHQKSSAFVIC